MVKNNSVTSCYLFLNDDVYHHPTTPPSNDVILLFLDYDLKIFLTTLTPKVF